MKNLKSTNGRVLSKTVAAFLNFSRQQVHRLGNDGTLRFETVGQRRLYFVVDIIRFKREREALASKIVTEEQLAEMLST